MRWLTLAFGLIHIVASANIGPYPMLAQRPLMQGPMWMPYQQPQLGWGAGFGGGAFGGGGGGFAQMPRYNLMPPGRGFFPQPQMPTRYPLMQRPLIAGPAMMGRPGMMMGSPFMQSPFMGGGYPGMMMGGGHPGMMFQQQNSGMSFLGPLMGALPMLMQGLGSSPTYTSDFDDLAPRPSYRPSSLDRCTSCGARRSTVERISYAPATASPRYVTRYSDENTEADGPGYDRVATADEDRTTPAARPRESRYASGDTARAARGVPPRRELPDPGPRARNLLPRNGGEARAHTAPIWPSFISNFRRCAPGCEPVQYYAYGHRHGHSCHPTGEALDLGGMMCNGRLYRSIDRGRFETMVNCMRRSMPGTLYFNGPHKTLGHQDHAHFSNGCISRGRRTY